MGFGDGDGVGSFMMSKKTHIRVVDTLDPNRSEDLLDPISSPFNFLTIDSDRLVLVHILDSDLLGMDLSFWIGPIER